MRSHSDLIFNPIERNLIGWHGYMRYVESDVANNLIKAVHINTLNDSSICLSN